MRSFLFAHKYSLSALAALGLGIAAYALYPSQGSVMDAHSAHKKAIAERLAGRGVPEMDLDISFEHSKPVVAGTGTSLSWQMRDRKTGESVVKFEKNMEKLLHLIVTNDSLTYFDHIHPTFDGGSFSIAYTFPKDDVYWLYLDFQPVGSSEIQKSFVLPVGEPSPEAKPSDRSVSKAFGAYKVALSSTFKARDIDLAKSHLTFTVTDSKTGKPVKDLRPYLGAFGHLVMINTADHSYIHAHPLEGVVTDDRSGPNVEFYPFDLRTGKLAPGTYRLFAQFNPPSGLFTADFTVDIR
ncbi:MAG: hypothetical protein HZA81_00200 [Candidatus Taylorbacteria bacterium]|nr:hypothetical protein [Candidatus Taylorbacteria bacterium]